MDLFTQNMINRTKQRQELIMKTKSSCPPLSEDTVENKTSDDAVAPSAIQESRKARLGALASRVNNWEDDSALSKHNASTPEKTPSKKEGTPIKRVLHLSATEKSEFSPAKSAIRSSPKTLPSSPKPGINKTVSSPTKSVVLDKSVLRCLESQGFAPTASKSRLIYEFEKEQQEEEKVEEESADSWIYADGTPQKLAAKTNVASPVLSENSSTVAKKPPVTPKNAEPKKSLLNNSSTAKSPVKAVTPKSNEPKKSCMNNSSISKSPVKAVASNPKPLASIITSTKRVATTTVSDNGPAVSVLKRAALFDSPRPPSKDPAELSLLERKALFERNKGQPPTPKVNSSPVPGPSSRTGASPIEPKGIRQTTSSGKVNTECDPKLKPMIGQALSAHKNAVNAKADRMKELEQIRNRYEPKKQQQQPPADTDSNHEDDGGDSDIEDSAESVVDELPAPPPIVAAPDKKTGSPAVVREFQRSPVRESYPGLQKVRQIKVSPPKPGKLYPCLSDIEQTTENETSEDEHEDDPVDNGCSGSPSVLNQSQDLDSSFTVDILGQAGLSQFINTPKRKLQEMQLSKQALMRSVAEQHSRVSDEDPDNIADISDLLNEALEHSNYPEDTTPPKQKKMMEKVSEDGNPMPLFHSVSSYRKQQQDQIATPAKQVVRNPEVRRADSSEASSHEGQSQVSIQQLIRNLQDEINTQQTVMAQASQALNLCRSTTEFSGSTEQVEGERLLLVATQKRQAAMNEIQRLKTEAAMKKTTGGFTSRGTLSISNVALPLKKEFLQLLAKGGDDFVHYFITLIRSRGQVIPLQMLSTADGVQNGALRFPNLIQLRDLPSDFQVTIEVYALQTRKEKLDHEVKYHIRKDNSKMRLTPKKLAHKQDSRSLSKSSVSSSAVRSSSFGLIGFASITAATLRRREWTLEKVPFASPIDGTLQLKIQCHAESMVEERGFLTVFEDVAGFGAWHRRWCLLSNDQLLFWKYPDDEKRKEPLSNISLRNCITDIVDGVSHDVCARPNTFLLVTVRPPQPGDKDSLVMTISPHRTALRHLISADLKEERLLWCAQINCALANLRAWDTEFEEPAN